MLLVFNSSYCMFTLKKHHCQNICVRSYCVRSYCRLRTKIALVVALVTRMPILITLFYHSYHSCLQKITSMPLVTIEGIGLNIQLVLLNEWSL